MITVADIFLAHAKSYEGMPALIADGQTTTFDQLAVQAVKTANALAARGIGPNDRVGVTTRNASGCIPEFIAIWMLGATVVPLDFRMPVAELAKLVAEFEIGVLLADKNYGLAAVDEVVRDITWQNMVATSSIATPDAPSDPGLAIISLTSGTTGRPIGVAFTHLQLFIRCTQSGRSTKADNAVFACAGLMSFSAVRNHTLCHLFAGTPVHFYPPLMDASEYIERLLSDKVTNAFAVPTMVRAMLAKVGVTSQPILPDLNCLYTGGSDMSADDKIAAYNYLTNGFLMCFSSSLTGTCSILTGADLLARPDSDGRIVDGVRVEVVDKNDQPVPEGEIGELRVRSTAMANGLIGGAGRVQGDKFRGGWAFTGDLASILDGFLTIRGRTGDFIVRGGANVYPSEIEHALMALDGVKECAVVGFASEREGQEIAAFVVADSLDEGALVRHCRETLSPDKRPRRFLFVDALPRNPNGKVLRKELVVT
jgi:long-chain acyl-CoA synthetase